MYEKGILVNSHLYLFLRLSQNFCFEGLNPWSLIVYEVWYQFDTPFSCVIVFKHFSLSLIRFCRRVKVVLYLLSLSTLISFFNFFCWKLLIECANDCSLMNSHKSNVNFLEFLSAKDAISWNIGVTNPQDLAGIESSIRSWSEQMWTPVIACRKVKQIISSNS